MADRNSSAGDKKIATFRKIATITSDNSLDYDSPGYFYMIQGKFYPCII